MQAFDLVNEIFVHAYYMRRWISLARWLSLTVLSRVHVESINALSTSRNVAQTRHGDGPRQVLCI